MSESTISQQLQACIDRLARGDGQARNELIGMASGRLTILTRKIFRQYSRLEQDVETLDVFHNAVIRLCRALEQINPPTVRDFYGLAALQIRRELLDLCRHRFGREGHERPPKQEPLAERSGPDGAGAQTYDPVQLAIWADFHEAVQRLEPAEREVVDLLWYQDLAQEEAAEVLGVDKSTVKRRWRAARLKLSRVVGGALS